MYDFFISKKQLCNKIIIILIVIVLYVSIQKIRLLITKYTYKKNSNQNPLKKIYDDHNYYRNIHLVSNLDIDTQLEKDAQRMADTCTFAHDFKDLKIKEEGENLYMVKMASSKEKQFNNAINNATNAWYNEVNLYNFLWPSFAKSTGHFTQLVWKDTKKIGCGYNYCNGMNLVACRYKNPGNMMGSFFSNVSLPIAKIPPFINYGTIFWTLLIPFILYIIYYSYSIYTKKINIQYELMHNNFFINLFNNLNIFFSTCLK